jgi:four helix bundle protein
MRIREIIMARRRSSIQRFEDLQVWQTARELVKGVYRAAKTQALRRDLGLVDQMTRAAVSIVSNIAEGHERGTRTEYVQYCYVAKGSAGELRAQVTVAHDNDLIDDTCFEWLHEKCEGVSALLGGYIKHLLETSNVIPGSKFTRSADRGRLTWEEFLEANDAEALPDGRIVSGRAREEMRRMKS